MSARVAFYEQWRDLLRSWGVTVLEAEGWRTRDNESGTAYDPGQLYVEHHDASTRLSGNWGALAYILSKGLANCVVARDGAVMLCAAGVQWHAGVGAYPGIPTNGANPRSLGDEVCNSGSEPYTAACTRSIILTEAAWCIVAGRREDRVIGHKEWAMPRGRKSDPSIDMNQRRTDVATRLTTTPTGDPFMALTDDQQIRLLAAAEKGAWLADQMKPQIDRLPDEDAQTDLLMWAVTDPDEGLRTLVASLQGQVTELTAAVGALSERLEPPA